MIQENLIGKEILNYRIESFIGGGGMGSVYMAANKNINQKVAVKVLNENFAESELVRQKFKDEARTLLALDHPNIVHFLNFEENADGLFLVMEYVDGITLDAFINQKQGLIPEKMAYPMFLQILDACTYAHKRGIIHRDIKPANIILTNDNEGNFVVKILDFGIAKIISESEEENNNEKGIIVGTPAYMSPEQVRGENLDKRSDIYSLGILLHQMLTGHAPYNTTTLSENEIQQKVVNEPLPRMKEFYPQVSDKMQRIVDKATQKDSAKRYQTCGDFHTALKNAIDPDKMPKMIKYAAAAIILLVLGGGWWFWDYNRVKVSYYKDYVEQWGVPVGIGKANYKHREKTYKFVYQYGKLQHLQLVNSKGYVVTDGESERFDRPINADFEYSDKHIAYILYKDKNGKPFFRKRYNKKDGKINMFVFEYNDDNGTDKRLPKDMTGYTRLEDENAERGQISRFVLEFDKNGYVTALHYRNQAGEAVGDEQHIFGKRYERDNKGRAIKEYFLTNNDSVTSTSWGLGIKEFTYDNKDNLIKVVYLTPNGLSSLDDKDGIAIYAMEYDNWGNMIYGWHKSSNDSLMLPKKSGVAGVYQVFNNKGENIETYYMGTDNKPMYSVKSGCIGIRCEYDEYGFVKKQTYIDENGKPAVASSGETYFEIVNDKNGNQLEIKAYDLDSKPYETNNGYFKTIAEYDSLGNQISVFYYCTNDSLCLTSWGYAGQRYKWNDKNNLIEYTYYGADNQPCAVNGMYIVKMEYDMRGNETKRSFYAANGKTPILSDGNIAGWEYEYDDNGNIKTMWYFDTKGKHTSGSFGYAGYHQVYNNDGYMEEISYFDINNKLAFNHYEGYAGIRYKYDSRGNVIELFHFGTNKRLSPKYVAMVHYKYDARNNVTEMALVNENGNPVYNNGCSNVIYVYNERNQEIERRYCDANHNLQKNKEENYAVIKHKYDYYGNEIESSFFDATNSPCVCKEGYASHKSEYDAMGRIVRQTYFDVKGQPTKPSVMVPEGLVGYDKWGNINYVAAADGNGNLIDNPQEGWTIKRSVFDIKGNKLEIAFFDKNDKPCIDKEYEAHRITFEYNEKGQLIEARVFNHLNKAMNCYDFSYKIIYSYDEQGYPTYRKYYDANNKLVMTEKPNKQTQEWERVDTPSANPAPESGGWRAAFQKLAEKCPFIMNDEDDTEMTSITLTSSGCTVTKRYLEISKYSVSDSDLEQKKNKERTWAQNVKKAANMPSDATLTLVGTDKANRELFRVKY